MRPATAWNLVEVADAAHALLTQKEPPRAVLESILTKALAKYYRERRDDDLAACAWTLNVDPYNPTNGNAFHASCGHSWPWGHEAVPQRAGYLFCPSCGGKVEVTP